MSQTADNTPHTVARDNLKSDQKLNARLLSLMALTTGLLVVVASFAAPWRVTTGLLIGGVLALINFNWLMSSTTVAFSVLVDGEKPRITILKYGLRYVVIGATVFVAYQLRLASLPALFLGLSTFVIALFVEAFRQFYVAITQREEN